MLFESVLLYHLSTDDTVGGVIGPLDSIPLDRQMASILCATLPFGVRWLCWGIVLYNFSDIGIIIYYSKKVISTGYMEQIKNIFPLFLLSLGMGMSAYIAQSMIKGSLPQLIIGGLVALFSYLLLGFLFKVRESRLLFSLIKKYI